MKPPSDDSNFKLEEQKEGAALFHCHLYDADIVHKISQEFLPGLASACVDNTTGGLFRTPAAVAVAIRKEMVDYLIQGSENFVAESLVLDLEFSEDPYDIVSDLIDDFAGLKRSLFSRVSGWLLSEKREERIDDFVQEMEVNDFWNLTRREYVAHTVLKNVDFKNAYHCSASFRSLGDVEEHKLKCVFRTVICPNQGCNSRLCAAQWDHHDLACPFKMLECEQKCSESIMRRGMDKHCITVCPKKLVKCPLYSLGCRSSVPQSKIDQHRLENLDSHLLCILQIVHKDASIGDLKGRVQEITESSSPGKLGARDARSLTFVVKDLDAKLGPLKVHTAEKNNKIHGLTDSFEESPPAANKECVDTPSKCSERKGDVLIESCATVQLESQQN